MLKSKNRFVLADVLGFPWKRNDIHILYVCSSSSLPFASKLLKCFHFQSFVFLQQKIKFSLCDSLHCFSQSKDLQTNKSKTSNHNYKLANCRYVSKFFLSFLDITVYSYGIKEMGGKVVMNWISMNLNIELLLYEFSFTESEFRSWWIVH